MVRPADAPFAPGMSGQRFQLAAFLILPMLVVLLETAYVPPFADPMEMGYVDMARHLAKGEGLATSMLAPYYMPRIPSPISLWPPLYPATVAAVSKLGIDVVVAARIVSIAAFGLSVTLVWLLGTMLFSRSVGTISAALLSVWPPVTRIAGMALSENLFVLCVLLSLLISLRLIRTEGAPTRWYYATAAGGGLAMGAAALTRYVGLALISVGAFALLLNLRNRSVGQRVRTTAVWSISAAIPAGLFLVRNILVTGSLIGAGRPPDQRGLVYHAVYAVKAVVVDASRLVSRITILPEVLGVESRVIAMGALGVIGLVLLAAARSRQIRRGLIDALGIPIASPESRFVTLIAVGYWGAMLGAHTVMGFMALSTRMMLPVYPLMLLATVAVLVALVGTLSSATPRVATRAAVFLCVAAIVSVIIPRSFAAGGPRLRPDPPPSWVTWVAGHTAPTAPIVGNSGFDYNFYLERPVLSFASFLEYRTGDRFDRDCRRIARNLTILGWNRAYLILHAEDGRLDADLLGRRYGRTIGRLVEGDLALPVRPIARTPEFVAYEILNVAWSCP